MSRALAAFLMTLFFSGGYAACTSAPKNEHLIQSLIPSSLRVRRPVGKSADPQAGPGGIDYTSHPVPNEKLDCEKADSLYRGIDLGAVRDCVIGLSAPDKELRHVLYRLRREDQPYLELIEPEDAPECLRKNLPRIPVPREIVFQAGWIPPRDPEPKPVAGEPLLPSPKPLPPHYRCYTSRLNLEDDEFLGSKLPMGRVALDLLFPLELLPKDNAETVQVLTGWSLAPLQEKERGGYWRSKVLTDRLCQQCLGQKNVLKDGHPASIFWPDVSTPEPSPSPKP